VQVVPTCFAACLINGLSVPIAAGDDNKQEAPKHRVRRGGGGGCTPCFALLCCIPHGATFQSQHISLRVFHFVPKGNKVYHQKDSKENITAAV
jgi:hypothetical protein